MPMGEVPDAFEGGGPSVEHPQDGVVVAGHDLGSASTWHEHLQPIGDAVLVISDALPAITVASFIMTLCIMI